MYGTTVLEQRCIFHKLRNVADKCREELKGEANKETRKQLMEQASALYQAKSAQEARGRLVAFAEQWRARTPKVVATLERDFEQTIAYYALDGVASELIRTTSLLERTNRELRRKFRQVCCFGSSTGAEVAIYMCRSNGSMLIVRSKLGGIPPAHCISISSISTLSKGYVI